MKASLLSSRQITCRLSYPAGAQALYLLDFQLEGLQELKELLKQRYSDVKVREFNCLSASYLITVEQVTILQADAADENSIKAICKHAVDENGRLE